MTFIVTAVVYLAIWPALLAQKWHTELDVAAKLSKENNKCILVYFSVNEYCETCRKLEAIFVTDEFISFAKERFILVKPSFLTDESEQKKINKLLIVEKYNKDGFFPHVVILDASLKMIGKMPVYAGEGLHEVIKSIKEISY